MKKILLVDDNEVDRALLQRYLRRAAGEQMELYEATTVAEALQQFQAVQPDCVLMDYNLPDDDGLYLMAQLQKLRPADALCVVMITGSGSEQVAVRALNNGALDYLVKDKFDEDLLVKVVRHAMERNEWRQYQGRYHDELQSINRQLRLSLNELTQARQDLHNANQQLRTANAEIQARNQALDSANRQLACSNQDLDNFVYAASHDLKQPVQNLRGLFEELNRVCTFEDEEAREIVRLTDVSLRDLMTTISDLSVVVRESRQPTQGITEEVVLADLIHEVQQALRTQLVETGATMQVDTSALPVLPYNRGHLRTIVLNLLSNALRYRQPGRPPHIEVRGFLNEAGQPVVEVRDNGLGIDLVRYQAELFQLFRRFHADTEEGTGVGLFLVNRIIHSYGGKLQVESTVGEGSTFRAILRG